MNKIFSSILIILTFSIISESRDNQKYLIVRGDDIGSSHAANLACIESYKNGIVRSVEIMVPCPWFLEAVSMLKSTPDLDVGVHLTLTSEWQNRIWGSLTNSQGLTDSSGYFFPFIWQNTNYPPNHSLLESNWTIKDIENEFRAQIELALKHLPRISHISAHMGCTEISDAVHELTEYLAEEYGLAFSIDTNNVARLEGYNVNKKATIEEKINNFIKAISAIESGNWLFVEHPGLDVPEMQAMAHIGYMNVAKDRYDILQILTNPKVKQTIKDKNIKLVSYADLKNNG